MDSIVLLALIALLVVAISWLWDYTVVRLIWSPYRTTKEFREKLGFHGPAYKFLKVNNEEISSMKEEADSLVLDVHDHDYFPKIAPHYLKWRAQYVILLALSMCPPGCNYLPTERNRRKWMLEKKLRNTLIQIIQLRLSSKDGEYGNDLLGLMLDACASDKQGEVSLSMDEIIDECKTFFFAGHETTSLLLTWTVFLLSVYPEWQERLRNEVFRECGRDQYPDANSLSKLKEITMVLLETLRLYNPAVFIQRKPITDIKVGSLKIPAGLAVYIPVPIMHRDKQIWGADADEFNPLRFQNGATRAAKIPHALLSTSQNFAMLEAKAVMAVMLHRFCFVVSPGYVHAPMDLITLKPKFGLPVKKIVVE
ncbi:hypothetical protein E2562_012795 [Oryza meyeriana var. granulata]|uniref:Cytochrome P450 n=1 Tax=Oryza meyeriana var. granulata TaxID=110450 RepID=A0A6G1DID4_9ORYZ|nr:hypothetical protein E2562_012795 [Oryza meyeriana var. granulata]